MFIITLSVSLTLQSRQSVWLLLLVGRLVGCRGLPAADCGDVSADQHVCPFQPLPSNQPSLSPVAAGGGGGFFDGWMDGWMEGRKT